MRTRFGVGEGMTYDEVLQLICGITKGPVSAEVVATDTDASVVWRDDERFVSTYFERFGPTLYATAWPLAR